MKICRVKLQSVTARTRWTSSCKNIFLFILEHIIHKIDNDKHRSCFHLILKAPSKIAADDSIFTFYIYIFFLLLFFEENKASCFMWILCLTENLHELSFRIFSQKQWKKIQSTLVISKSKGPSKTVRDIRTSTYQICSIEEKTIWTTNFYKWLCNLTPLEIY